MIRTCTHCKEKYEETPNHEDGLCTKDTLLSIKSQQKILVRIKHAVHGDTFYKEIRFINEKIINLTK